MRLTVLDSPLAAVHLTAVMDSAAPAARVREAEEALTAMLVAEAFKFVPTQSTSVQSLLGPASGRILRDDTIVVTLLPDGLALLQIALRFADMARIAFLVPQDSVEGYELLAISPRIDGSNIFLLAPQFSSIPFVSKVIHRLFDMGAREISFLCFATTSEALVEIERMDDRVKFFAAAVNPTASSALQMRSAMDNVS